MRLTGVSKRFYRYEHRTTSLREFFIRTVLRRPLALKRACFSLEGLTLTVARGEAVAFIGRNVKYESKNTGRSVDFVIVAIK